MGVRKIKQLNWSKCYAIKGKVQQGSQIVALDHSINIRCYRHDYIMKANFLSLQLLLFREHEESL